MPNVPASSAKSVVTLPPGSVDTHAHVFTRELRLAPDPRYVPESGAPIERYLNLLDAHGIAAGILVQPSFLGTDNEYLIAALARVPARLRGVAVVAPETSQAALEKLRASGVAGIRLNLIGRPPLNSRRRRGANFSAPSAAPACMSRCRRKERSGGTLSTPCWPAAAGW